MDEEKKAETNDDGVTFTLKFTKKMVADLEKEAAEIGIPRSNLIKVIVAAHYRRR